MSATGHDGERGSISMATKSIAVGVSRRVLHIGSSAYPLQAIARVTSEVIRFKRWPAIRAFIGATVLWIILGVAATVVVKFAVSDPDAVDGSQGHYLAIVRVVAICLVAFSALRLLFRLRRTWRRYYTLVIETAGAASAVLVNPDGDLIRNIAHRIVEAIDEPLANWSVTVNDHRHTGDVINQSGSGSVGKVTY